MDTNSNFGLEEENAPSQEYAKPTLAKYAKGFMLGIVANICAAVLTALLTIWFDAFHTLMLFIPAFAGLMPKAILVRGKDIVTAVVCAAASFVSVPTFQFVLDYNNVYLESLDSEFSFYLAMATLAAFAGWSGYKDFGKSESKSIESDDSEDTIVG